MVQGNRLNLRFADAIPVFESRLQIALEKIHRSEEVVGVSVGRIGAQRATKRWRGLRQALLFESNTGEFHHETLVFRGKAASREQSPARVLPPSQLRQRAPAVVLEIWSESCLRLERL